MVADQINWNVDKVLLGRFSGTIAVAIYGIGSQLNTMYMQMSTIISNVFIPQVNRIVADSNDNRLLTELLTKVGRVQFLVLTLISCGFVFLGREFIYLWAGDAYEQSYAITLLLIFPATIPLAQNVVLEIMRAKNMHKVRSVMYFAMAIANVIISIPLIQLWGGEGAALGTAIVLILGDCVFMNIYYHKRVGLNMIYYWEQILRFIPAFLVIIICEIIVTHGLRMDSVILFLVHGIIYMLVFGIAMWFLGLNQTEKELIRGPLRKIGHILKITRKIT